MKCFILAALCIAAVSAQYHGTGGGQSGGYRGGHSGGYGGGQSGGYGGHHRGRRSLAYTRTGAGYFAAAPSVVNTAYASSVAIPPAPIGGNAGSTTGQGIGYSARRGHRYARSPIGVYGGHGAASYSGAGIAASHGGYSSGQSGHS